MISIHAPREGGDVVVLSKMMRERSISIHAPREGGDCVGCLAALLFCHFNPRPPRGGRLRFLQLCPTTVAFQSTPPARGATEDRKPTVEVEPISIHAPREGGDVSDTIANMRRENISIHAPREGGDAGRFHSRAALMISIHAPREGGDSKDAQFYLRIFDK